MNQNNEDDNIPEVHQLPTMNQLDQIVTSWSDRRDMSGVWSGIVAKGSAERD